MYKLQICSKIYLHSIQCASQYRGYSGGCSGWWRAPVQGSRTHGPIPPGAWLGYPVCPWGWAQPEHRSCRSGVVRGRGRSKLEPRLRSSFSRPIHGYCGRVGSDRPEHHVLRCVYMDTPPIRRSPETLPWTTRSQDSDDPVGLRGREDRGAPRLEVDTLGVQSPRTAGSSSGVTFNVILHFTPEVILRRVGEWRVREQAFQRTEKAASHTPRSI